MSNQQIETNPQNNPNSFSPEENFNLNINNYDLDMIQQKQQIDNLPIEEILKKIDKLILYMSQNLIKRKKEKNYILL